LVIFGGFFLSPSGGASGIGRAVCARLAREGATVAIADCDEAGAAQTLKGLQPGDHQVLHVDVGCARSVAGLVADIQTSFSRPASVCVNCAGITMDEFL
ncbi:(3R)-3-hydroxyacyl-CoA dehydrogenase-like, partial [Sceloporus undulatus]|uniref:(3R)-3-hydroxyacyl-CoA dehydrogenase-like n=1 Tax=Sceloporus undulatus TaxID=8520 RepID=UPI001C4B92B8